MVVLLLAFAPAAAPAAAAASVVGACQLVAAAQEHACPCGTITITQTEDSTTTTPIGNTGGTTTDEAHLKDATTIQIMGAAGGSAQRVYTMSHTVTRHEIPSVQCAAGQPFTTGTHTVVQDEQQSGTAAAHVDVTIDVDPACLYSIETLRPVPGITRKVTYNESWNICRAPAPTELLTDHDDA